mmetsp:Transcript_83948/g.140093  ORF Transcript_83948/g.140093 Transcript_83948/m.140093 type:complete len:213 (+) Transcript_83948:723-1361(+)
MAVTPSTPTTCGPTEFNWHMVSVWRRACSGVSRPFLPAVPRMPTPSGLVRYNRSPALAVEFFLSMDSGTRPLTARPKIGSGLSMLCPPANAIPASAHARRPPSTTRPATAGGSFSRGQPRIAMAIRGVPPIAYTSLMALVAAMRPKSCGSSTMGMKKSVVLMRPWPSPRSYTAASSFVPRPTSSRGSACSGPVLESILSSTLGEILQPQPPP